MNENVKLFIGNVAQAVVHAKSFVPGDAKEIEEYFLAQVAAKQTAQTEPAKPLDFVHDLENLIVTGAPLFNNEKITGLASALVETAEDAEAGKVFQLLPDLLQDWKAVKAFKK